MLSEFPILVPNVDTDGNETAGLMMPEVVVPLATYTGWNLFRAESGPTNVLSSMQGSYIPFPRTAAIRQRTGDRRLSIEERYGSRAEYLGLVSEAALALVETGYLLVEDMAPIVAQAGSPLGVSHAGHDDQRAVVAGRILCLTRPPCSCHAPSIGESPALR